MDVASVCNQTYFETSLVDASWIKSQMQANFMQIFPFNYDKLPLTHSTDKDIFEKYWEGDKTTTFEQFMKRNKLPIKQ